MSFAGAAASATAGGPPAAADTFVAGARSPQGGGVAESLVKLLGALTDLISKLAQLLQGGGASASVSGAAASASASADANAAATATASATATAAAPAAPETPPETTSSPPSSDSSASSSAESAPPVVDGSSFVAALMANGRMAAEGDDPLMFDLDGTGAGFDTTHTVGADLKGQGAVQVNDLKRGTGLLTFDATPEDGAATTHRAGAGELSHTFGNRTDLSAYGIKGDRPDGSFSNGFTALRAAGEHFGMIRPGKEYLDAGDLKTLEQTMGLKMRVGGLQGQDRGLADLGISRIDLGAAAATETKAQGTRDANGNVLQHQGGAAFTIDGQQRSYVDGWFREEGAQSA